MALIKLSSVKKIYQDGEIAVKALRGVNLEVAEGEFATVYGPSGSGKTTLLNLVGALDKPTSGRVQINGSSIGELNKNELAILRRNNIGFIFQSYNLIPVLTAYENVEFALKIADGKKVSKNKEKAIRILEDVGLGDMLSRRLMSCQGVRNSGWQLPGL